MRISYVTPSGVLSRFIRYYWVMEIDASEGEVSEQVIPTDTIELMFHYKNPFIDKTGPAGIMQPRSLLSGLKNSFRTVATCGDSGVITVSFLPAGACNFFRFPLLAIQNQFVSLCDIDAATGKQLEDAINSATTLRQRIEAIELYLMKQLQPVSDDDLRLLQTCISCIASKKGRIAASDLGRRVFMSEKSLERKFSRFIGKTPKQFLRIIRFQEVVKNISAMHGVPFSQVALENGYYDQAHFIRDFRALSGLTPKEFISLQCHKYDVIPAD